MGFFFHNFLNFEVHKLQQLDKFDIQTSNSRKKGREMNEIQDGGPKTFENPIEFILQYHYSDHRLG